MRARSLPFLKLFTLLLAACSQAAAPTAAATIKSDAVATVTAASLPTPRVPMPTAEHGLSARNAAEMIFESGVWVVKNPAGEVTASWDSTKNQWTYKTENISQKQVFLSFGTEYLSIHPEQFGSLPVATAENTLTYNGLPLQDGTVLISEEKFTSEDRRQPTALIAGRIVGAEEFDIKGTGREAYVLYFNVRATPDSNILIASTIHNEGGFAVFALPSGDASDVNLVQTEEPHTPIISVTVSELVQKFSSGDWSGQQVLLNFPFDFSPEHFRYDENDWRAVLLRAFQERQLPA